MKPELCQLVTMKVGVWRGDIARVLYLMRTGDVDELQSHAALDAHAIARDLRELADRIEAVAKDYGREDAA